MATEEQKLRKAIREIIKEEMLSEAKLTPDQEKIKAFFSKKGGKVSNADVTKFISLSTDKRAMGGAWSDLKKNVYVGQKSGSKDWNWV